MYIDTHGIILRSVKTTKGRVMLTIFTKELGKISAGSYPVNRKKTKASLAQETFTYGEYHIAQKEQYYDIESAEALRSFFGIGEQFDRFVDASYVMELTDKILPEGLPQPEIFDMLLEYLDMVSVRKERIRTLTEAYEIKLLYLLGVFPELDECVNCGAKDGLDHFGVEDGGMLCGDCASSLRKKGRRLIYKPEFDIVKVIKFFLDSPFKAFEKIALSEGSAASLDLILKEYFAYHFGIEGLKSESLQHLGS
jgi:DNA repair protein RecO (recombination protein O)